jgi:hypothetical protein
MTNNEIKRSYNEARDKPVQIEILSQLTLKPIQAIAEIVGAELSEFMPKHCKKAWTDEDDKKLTDYLAEGKPHAEIAVQLGRSYDSVRVRAGILGRRNKAEVEYEKIKQYKI